MGFFKVSKGKLQELETDLRNVQAENRRLQQALAECKPKQKNSSIVGSLLKPTDRTKSAGPVSTENLPVPNRSEPYHLVVRSLPASNPPDRPDLTLQITNLSNELRRAQLDIRGKQAKITKLERKLSEEYERPTRKEPRNSSPVQRRRREGSPPQRLREEFQSLQQENESLKRRLQELHGVFEREKQMEVQMVWEEVANSDQQHHEKLESVRAEMRGMRDAVRQETESYIAKIRESHQAELQQQRRTSEATLAQRETRIAELEQEIQEKTARIADTRLVLDQTRNAERQRAIRAAEELAERDRRFEFIQQECARMAAGGR